jgi:predicted lactoylglutathione lyase
MGIGDFSVSLAVKDIRVSKAFCEALGFYAFMGKLEENW